MGWWVRLSDIAREISVTILARCWSEIKIRSWFLWQVVYNRIKTMQVTSLAVHIYTDAYIYIYPCHVCITWTYYRIALRTYQLFPELAFVQEKSRRPKTMAMVPMMSHDVSFSMYLTHTSSMQPIKTCYMCLFVAAAQWPLGRLGCHGQAQRAFADAVGRMLDPVTWWLAILVGTG